MRILRSLRRRLRSILKPEMANVELSEELQFHLARQLEENLAAGMPPDEARRAAQMEFGSVARITEQCHNTRELILLQELLRNAHYGMRSFRKNPGFTVVTLLTLSLGIGICTAMFTVLYGVLLRPMPYVDAHQLAIADQPLQPGDTTFAGVSGPNARDWREQSRLIEQLAYYDERRTSLAYKSNTSLVHGISASSNLFSTLGVRPMLGHSFTEADHTSHAQVTVLGYDLWKEFFGSDPGVINQDIQLNGQTYQVIGVMPSSFTFPFGQNWTLWTPLGRGSWDPDETQRGWSAFQVLLRLKPGVTPTRAQVELSGIQQRIAQQYKNLPLLDHVRVRSYREFLVGNVKPAVLALAVAVAFVWLIACVNVASLLMARYGGRQQDLAVRSALGASTWRLTTQLLTENLLLSGTAGLLSLTIAQLVIKALKHFLLQNLPAAADIRLNLPVLFTLLGLTIFSAIIFGFAPAIQAARAPLNNRLRAGVAVIGLGPSRTSLRNALVVGELALSLVLLVGAGLLLRSLYALHHVSLGFSTENVVTIHFALPFGRFATRNVNSVFYEPLIQHVEHLPGVKSASITSVLPLQQGSPLRGSFGIVGQEAPRPNQVPQGDLRFSSPEYPQTMGIPVGRGRFFTETDTPETEPVVVVNQSFGARYFPGQDPVGKQLAMHGSGPWSRVSIVGVLDDVHQTAIGLPPGPEIHLSTTQLSPEGQPLYIASCLFAQLAVRSRLPSSQIVPELLDAARKIAPDFTPNTAETMEQIVDDSIGSQTLAARLMFIFAAAALLIAMAGVYGVLAYSVTQRRHEMGIRIALGAKRSDVLMLILKNAAFLLTLGLGAGIAISMLAAHAIRSFLFGVGGHDAVTIISVCVLLTACGMIAAFVPARRAASIEPMETLRTE
jgi:predicted permease